MPKNMNTVTRITTQTTTQVKTGPCVLHRIIFSVPASTGTVNIIDGVAGTTSTHGVITSTADVKPFVIECGYRLSSGLRVVTGVANQDITFVWEPA